ncbi:hypothetical protein [Streptomyces johnsoniae]|uniref:MFS transporter n=1 Tax=Streptomyces johnsoniae TaxID=3075532 RepID=A0ABU2S987_9ACTN|nr:hypothetical protein [Streptomyces sp. DSM 41886]MDT0444665.1 hypothetical protein [Streptomyces sp. DSM 41886]
MLANTLAIAASAFGPLALSVGRDLTGGYGPVLLVLATIPVAAALAALLTRAPGPVRYERR